MSHYVRRRKSWTPRTIEKDLAIMRGIIFYSTKGYFPWRPKGKR